MVSCCLQGLIRLLLRFGAMSKNSLHDRGDLEGSSEIQGLSYGTNDDSLRDAFSGFGQVVEEYMLLDDQKRHQGFGCFLPVEILIACCMFVFSSLGFIGRCGSSHEQEITKLGEQCNSSWTGGASGDGVRFNNTGLHLSEVCQICSNSSFQIRHYAKLKMSAQVKIW